MEITKHGITAYLTQLDNGLTELKIEGQQGSACFAKHKEALKYVDMCFEKLGGEKG